MHLFRRARVPLACLPAPLHPSTPEGAGTLEPWREYDISVDGDRIQAVDPAAPEAANSAADASTDLGGAIVFPGLIDAHTHLDKAHTWNRAPNPRGDFWDALNILQADSTLWTPEDLRRRAHFALRRAWGHGTVAIRTHIDSGGASADDAHAVMQELQREWAGRITLQTVSLCNVAQFVGDAAERILDVSARHRATALGGFPQPGPDLPAQLDRLMTGARELGVGLDLHVDESGLPHAECLRAVAEAVLRNAFPHPVTCGHCCSLAVQSPERQRDTIALVREAGIAVISLPLCNLYLQGRTRHTPAPGKRKAGVADGPPGTPSWRGLTLLHELMEAGVTVACASDNVRDAFYAYGDLDAAEVFVQSVRLGHLDTRLPAAPGIVTTAPASIMGLPDHGQVAPGARADLVVFEARTFSELLASPSPPRRLIRGEGFRERALPAYAELDPE